MEFKVLIFKLHRLYRKKWKYKSNEPNLFQRVNLLQIFIFLNRQKKN